MKKRVIPCLLAPIVIATAESGAAVHKPVFSWQIRGDVNYQQGIYDGADRIAVLDLRTLDEPMQSLMFFGKVPQPILLRQLKLTPAGQPLVQAVQLFWKSGNVIADVLDGLSVSGNGTDCLTVVFTVKDPQNAMKVERTLTVTYDASLGSYLYDFRDRAVVNSPEKLGRSGDKIVFEYCDPWFTDCPAPSQEFPGMWKGRYDRFVYESSAGGLVAIPHTHLPGAHQGGKLKLDGILAAVFEPDGNPAIQFMDKTAAQTGVSMCPWGYDLHLCYSAELQELARPLTTHFRIFQLPADRAESMSRNATMPPPADFKGFAELPVYERLSSFEKGAALRQPRQGNIDPWFWQPQGEKGAGWDRTFGRADKNSLRIEKDTPGLAAWYSMCEGQGYFTEPWTPCKGYEISIWVKTKDAAGPGASIGACYHIPNVPPAWPVTCSEKVTGTRDWTKVTLRMGPPPGKASIMSLHLQLEGKGSVWFDDLEVRMLR